MIEKLTKSNKQDYTLQNSAEFASFGGHCFPLGPHLTLLGATLPASEHLSPCRLIGRLHSAGRGVARLGRQGGRVLAVQEDPVHTSYSAAGLAWGRGGGIVC